MAVYQRGNVYWYKFKFGNRLIRESAKTHLKTLAREAERQRRRELRNATTTFPRKTASVGL